MSKTTLKFLRYTSVMSESHYCLKIQLFSSNKSHRCLPNVQVWDDFNRGIENFSSQLRFTGPGKQIVFDEVGEVTLENTDIAIISFYPKTQNYKVEGTRRKHGAIGKHVNFCVIVTAENEEQAKTIARHGSYFYNYEHILIKKIKLENK